MKRSVRPAGCPWTRQQCRWRNESRLLSNSTWSNFSLQHTRLQTGTLPACRTACLPASTLTACLMESVIVETSSSAGFFISSVIVRMRLASLYLGGQTDRFLLSLPLQQPLYAQVRSRISPLPICRFKRLNTIAASPEKTRREERSRLPPAARRVGSTT